MYSKTMQKIGFIGTGRVGTAIAYALKSKEYQIIGANDQNQKKTKAFYNLLKLKHQRTTNREITQKADIIFITTQDSEIEKVYNKIFPYLREDQIIIHCSGVLNNSIFKDANRKGIMTIGLHPIQTFPTIRQAIGGTKNIYYAIEATGRAKQIAKRIVRDLEGTPVFISGKDKPLYHTMCVFASNYLVALISAVIDIATQLKIKLHIAFRTLEPLITRTLRNVKKDGIEKSLSGPIARGDVNTITSHLAVLNKKIPKLLPSYYALGLRTLDLAKWGLNKKTIVTIERLLKR